MDDHSWSLSLWLTKILIFFPIIQDIHNHTWFTRILYNLKISYILHPNGNGFWDKCCLGSNIWRKSPPLGQMLFSIRCKYLYIPPTIYSMLGQFVSRSNIRRRSPPFALDVVLNPMQSPINPSMVGLFVSSSAFQPMQMEKIASKAEPTQITFGQFASKPVLSNPTQMMVWELTQIVISILCSKFNFIYVI